MRARHVLSTLALAVATAVAVPTAVGAEDGPTVDPGGNDTIDVGHGGGSGPGSGGDGRPGRDGGGGGGGGRGGGGGDGPTEPPPPTILDPQVLFRDGLPCVVAGSQPGDPDSRLALDLEIRYLSLRSRYGPCPDDTGAGGAGAVPSAATAVAAWADQVQLPSPELDLRPGLAIVGKASYLAIAGARDGAWRFEAFGWSIDVVATSTYNVDWGDGSVDAGVTTQGGPWPDGDLTHTYLTAGAFTIEVTQHWTADWTATGHGAVRSGRIEGLLWTVGSLPDFRVEEVQAVRSR